MAAKNHVSLTEAKQRLGELVKRAAYGGERIVLEFRDKPQAAIVSYEDLRRLEADRDSKRYKWETLDRLDAIRERIAARTGKLPDSAEDIARLREERTTYLAGSKAAPSRRRAALARLRELRESLPIDADEVSDSAKDIEELREDRLDDILGLH